MDIRNRFLDLVFQVGGSRQKISRSEFGDIAFFLNPGLVGVLSK